MKKIIPILIFFCIPKFVAQNATVTSGGNALGSGGSSSYSVGQIAYTNLVGSNGSISQGIQLPIEILTLGTDNFPEILLQMTVYPNPTVSSVSLLIPNYQSENTAYQLLNNNGRLIKTAEILQKETLISLENLPATIYLLTISSNNKIIKTFKIIKNN